MRQIDKLFIVFLTQCRLISKFYDNWKYPLATIQAAQNQNQTNAGGLANFLKLKIGAKAILKVNLDIHDHLINCQTGNTSYNEFAEGSVGKVYLKFSDEQADINTTRSPHIGSQNY